MSARIPPLVVFLFCASMAQAAPGAAKAPPSDPSSFTPTLNPQPPKSIWDLSPEGSATHLQSGMICPRVSGDFTILGQQVYDRAGFDVSCGYSNKTMGVITIYLARRDPARLEEDFESAKKAVISRTPSAVLQDRTLPLPAGLAWKSAGYSQNGGAMDSDLALASLSGWEFEIRATYIPARQSDVAQTLADLTATVAKSAGQHLAACAAAPMLSRSSVPVSDQKQLLVFTLSASVTGSVAIPGENEPVWCAENAFLAGDHPYVFWRNITAVPKGGPADRITPIGDGRTVTILFDAAATELAGKETPESPHTIYDVEIDEGASVALVAVLDGRPSGEDVAKLVLLRASVPVLARFSKTDHHITIYQPKP